MVTVGYERIRGLRDAGQRRDGTYEASKRRTFAVPVSKLFDAFAKPRLRARWLLGKSTVRTSKRPKTMRLTRSAAERVKASWAMRFEALAELLA